MRAEVIWSHVVVWFTVLGWHVYLVLARLGLVKPVQKMGGKMKLNTPFEVAPLVADLKAKGIPNVEKVVNDAVGSILDWVNSSVDLEAQKIPLLSLGIPALKQIEQKALDELKAFEDKLTAP